MKLKDLNLGNIDAKNELLKNSEEERRSFINSYVLPPNLNIDGFLTGRKYFITGLKGTGKTALLRYIAIQLEEENPNLYSHFILFKSDLSEEDRKSLVSKSNSNNVDHVNKDIDNVKFDSYISSWKYFLYDKIVDIQTNKNINIFQKNKDWEDFVSLVKAVDKKQFSFIPKIKHGSITLSKEPSITADLDWENQSKSIKFELYIKSLNKSFESLSAGESSLNIFFDELELSFYKKKQLERDIKLIRDLIVTIDQINSLSKKQGFNINIFSAIRTEVKNSIHSSGLEINKTLSDFGLSLIWHKAGVDDESQPILNVITNRLKYQVNKDISDDELWDNLFPKHIQQENTKRYILHNSWYRPRDVIRLLKLAQDENPESECFSHHIFDSIRQKYSEESWFELREELTAKYRPEEIAAIERIFESFKSSFSLAQFFEHVTETKELYSHEGDINDDQKFLKMLLTDLYDIGFLGNVIWNNKTSNRNNIFKFSYRGDNKINLKDCFYIHPSLKKHFNIS